MSDRPEETPFSIHVDDRIGAVSAILLSPADPFAVYVFGHGAGAGMRHPFMQTMAERLAERGLATVRYQFPYTEAGKRRPDPKPRLLATVDAAIEAARARVPDRPLLAGGKSMGGRMTSLFVAGATRPDTRAIAGLVFLGFPLHPARKPSALRAEHLASVPVPMLFVSGTRDALADLPLLRGVISGLGPRAELSLVEGGDHSLSVGKRRPVSAVLECVADTVVAFAQRIVRTAAPDSGR